MVRDAINKDFGDIFNESLKEYRLNFNLFPFCHICEKRGMEILAYTILAFI